MAQAASSTPPTNLPPAGVRATADQICSLYQISRTTWWRWSKAPNFPAPVRFGRTVRWDIAAVDAFLTGKEG